MCNSLYAGEMEQVHRIAVAASGVPPRYFLWRNRFEARGEAATGLLGAATAWVAGYVPGKSLGWALTGCVGCGKSHLAAYMAQTVMRRYPWGSSPRVRVLWQGVPALFMRIRGTYGDNAVECEWDIMQAMSAPDLLILDDMGVERPKVWVLEILYNILNERGNAGKTTCYTSNLSGAKLQKRLSEGTDGKDGDPDLAARIISRMAGDSKKFPVAFPAVDFRTTKVVA